MGGCISTNNNEAEASSISKKKQLVNAGSDEVLKLKGFSHESRAPPTSAEEETVKEVLSEAPKPKPIPKPGPNFTSYVKQEARERSEEEIKNAHVQKNEIFAKVLENQHCENNITKKQQLSGNEEVMSEVSETCTLSMSESLSTMTNVTDKRNKEEEQEVKQQRVSRSPVKFQPRNGVKNKVVSQSPTRRSDQSPGRRTNNGSIQFAQSSRQEAGPRLRSSSNRGKRDPGESSGRKSSSPTTTRSTAPMDRGPSARIANWSPSRVKTDPMSRNCSDSHIRNCSPNELLENPLVSLECFIFL